MALLKYLNFDQHFIFCSDTVGGSMKSISCCLFSLILAFSSLSVAKIQDLNESLSKATKDDTSNLGKLLTQVTMIPTKEKHNGKMLFKITKIEKDSLWERVGWKVGDLVAQ